MFSAVVSPLSLLAPNQLSLNPGPNVEDDCRDGDPVVGGRDDGRYPLHCARIIPDCSPLCRLVSGNQAEL